MTNTKDSVLQYTSNTNIYPNTNYITRRMTLFEEPGHIYLSVKNTNCAEATGNSSKVFYL